MSEPKPMDLWAVSAIAASLAPSQPSPEGAPLAILACAERRFA